MSELSYRDRLIQAITGIIVRESNINGNARSEPNIMAAEALAAINIIAAGLVEGVQDCRAPEGLQQISESFAYEMRVNVRRMQRTRAETGRRFFPVDLFIAD